MKISEIPYRRNSAEVFDLIADEEWGVFLDSGYPFIDSGRFDVMAARPYMTFLSRGQETVIDAVGGDRSRSSMDPFLLVRQHLGEVVENLTGIPFCGGAIGCFAYDLCRRIERLPAIAADDLHMPDMALGLYDWAVVVDHHKRRSWLVGQCRSAATTRAWGELERMFRGAGHVRLPRYQTRSGIASNMDREAYGRAFDQIKRYIRDGDCYQVNLAQRFDVQVGGHPWDIYLHMRKSNPAPFSAYMNLPGLTILSSSPERFLNVVGGQVETRPIKGTIRRSPYAYEDKALAAQLLESDKDRAENLMIVDLLRNDIGKTCQIGSVAVPKLFALESFATVHHLVSTVTGRLPPDRHALDLLRGCFPGGSITGAPKIRAMEIIEELEPHRRGVYCGSIGYVSNDGSMDTSITIRTAVLRDEHLYYWAGGGIVADSAVEAEYDESFAKASAVMRLFGQERATGVGG